MTIDAPAAALRDPAIVIVDKGWYWNKTGRQGYWGTLYFNGWWYHFSVSNTEVAFAPDEVADAITSPERDNIRVGTYTTEKDSLESTIRVAEHCYMINASGPPERAE